MDDMQASKTIGWISGRMNVMWQRNVNAITIFYIRLTTTLVKLSTSGVRLVEMRLLCHTEVNSWDRHPIGENFENLVFNLVHSDSDAFFSLSGQFTTFLPFSRHFRTIQTRSLMWDVLCCCVSPYLRQYEARKLVGGTSWLLVESCKQ